MCYLTVIQKEKRFSKRKARNISLIKLIYNGSCLLYPNFSKNLSNKSCTERWWFARQFEPLLCFKDRYHHNLCYSNSTNKTHTVRFQSVIYAWFIKKSTILENETQCQRETNCAQPTYCTKKVHCFVFLRRKKTQKVKLSLIIVSGA